ASSCEFQYNLASDPASAADDGDDSAAEFRLGWHSSELGFFERPVLDPKRFTSRQRDVVVALLESVGATGVSSLRKPGDRGTIFQRVRALHHMQRVDEKFGRDACFFLGLAEAKQAQTRNDDNRRV